MERPPRINGAALPRSGTAVEPMSRRFFCAYGGGEPPGGAAFSARARRQTSGPACAERGRGRPPVRRKPLPPRLLSPHIPSRSRSFSSGYQSPVIDLGVLDASTLGASIDLEGKQRIIKRALSIQTKRSVSRRRVILRAAALPPAEAVLPFALAPAPPSSRTGAAPPSFP